MDKEGNEISLLDIIEGENVDIPEMMDLEADTRRLCQVLQEALTEREREVLRLRYGLFGAEEKHSARSLRGLVSRAPMFPGLKRRR